uniref:Uncharacterized protein n=1 Tax=Lepeophtheirus salmonis TaxID=72036 RepID=A0A0K2TVP0_LEPSM
MEIAHDRPTKSPYSSEQCTSSQLSSCGCKINGNRVSTRDTQSTSNLTHLQPYVIHHLIIYFSNDFCCSNLNRTSKTLSITCVHMTTLKILKPLINCSNQRCRGPIMFIKLLFSLRSRLALFFVLFF